MLDLWPTIRISKRLKDSISGRFIEEISPLSTKGGLDNFISAILILQANMIRWSPMPKYWLSCRKFYKQSESKITWLKSITGKYFRWWSVRLIANKRSLKLFVVLLTNLTKFHGLKLNKSSLKLKESPKSRLKSLGNWPNIKVVLISF